MAEQSTSKPGVFQRFGDWIRNKVSSEPESPKVAEVNVFDLAGQLVEQDYRVRIKVPGNYLRDSTQGNPGAQELKDGIIFPYTPGISYDVKADYQSVNAAHSNYTQYFYNYSAVGQISIQGKFTVQNDKDARVYLSTKHLLSALVKMPFGDDPGAGSPPPVCRLYAYGNYMLHDIPIVISNFRIELPADVDYFNVGKSVSLGPTDKEIQDSATGGQGIGGSTSYAQSQGNTRGKDVLIRNFVPVSSTINITCYPVYSRREMLQFSLKNFLEDYDSATKYL